MPLRPLPGSYYKRMTSWIRLLKKETQNGSDMLRRFHQEDDEEPLTDLEWAEFKSQIVISEHFRALLYLANEATAAYTGVPEGLYRLVYPNTTKRPQIKWINHWVKKYVS